MSEIKFNTTNESKVFKRPLIKSGQYEFKISDIKASQDKSKNFFILDIIGQTFEERQVSLIWSAPVNDEYTPNTNVGKLFNSVGVELGGQISASALIGLKGKCIVNDCTQQKDGKVTTFSIVADLIMPEIVEPQSVDTDEAGIEEDGSM